jgi:uncharacterized protein
VAPERAMVMHRIRSDQLYHHYAGHAPRGVAPPRRRFGRRNRRRERPGCRSAPSAVDPGPDFHVSRVAPRGSWALLATTVFPGLVPYEDVELGDLDKLVGNYSGFAEQILSFGAGATSP